MGDVADRGGEKVRRLSAAWMMARPCDVSLRCIITGDVSTRLLPSGDLIDDPLLCLLSWDISTRGRFLLRSVSAVASVSAVRAFAFCALTHMAICPFVVQLFVVCGWRAAMADPGTRCGRNGEEKQ